VMLLKIRAKRDRAYLRPLVRIGLDGNGNHLDPVGPTGMGTEMLVRMGWEWK